MGKLNLLGLNVNISSEFGLVWIYIIGSVLIGVGCFIWQGMQLAILKRYVKGFSVRRFFKEYWLKVYPLAWSTSSEVVSMPLNMSLIKRSYPEVKRTVRKLIIGLGAYMNINGTTMHVILLAGIVACLVGYRPSLFQLAIGVPIIALIGYGVPGIPGELVLFAVPVVKILNLPEPIIALFMALYLALQVGLPDSFRTGANVTDNGIYAIGLNKLYKDKFMAVNKIKIKS
jgi:Na+/H+-dicarboxylate symporter